VPDFYRPYIALVEQDDVNTALRKTNKKFRKFLKNIPDKKTDYAYAEGKWTIKEALQHIIDAERVFGYRALWFARKDIQPLPGFDENAWAVHADVSGRKWEDMVDEFKSLRRSTEHLFDSFTEEELKASGTSNNKVINVEAIGYICAGHVAHHIKIIKERYL
jgi:hypothetical protein